VQEAADPRSACSLVVVAVVDSMERAHPHIWIFLCDQNRHSSCSIHNSSRNILCNIDIRNIGS
jgi:hypothetical protein